jgi:hypothetical protein
MWIAFESMYSFGRGSIIENILRYVPRTYASFSLMRRLNYIKKLLVDNEIEVPDTLRGLVSLSNGRFSEASTVGDIFEVVRSETFALDLFNSISQMEQLRFTIRKAHEVFKSNATILSRFKRSAADVDGQIRRIYAIRNKIAHTGHYGNVRPQLISHLYDYLVNSIHALHVASTVSRHGKVPISDLFDSFSLGLDLMESRLGSDVSIRDVRDLEPSASL